jgi:hypothetical protein
VALCGLTAHDYARKVVFVMFFGFVAASIVMVAVAR